MQKNLLTLMSVLFLTACAQASVIPDELTREVVVVCPSGYTSRALGQCLTLHVAALAEANSKLASIKEIGNALRR